MPAFSSAGDAGSSELLQSPSGFLQKGRRNTWCLKIEIMMQMRIEAGLFFRWPEGSQLVLAGKFANANCSKMMSVGLGLIASWGL